MSGVALYGLAFIVESRFAGSNPAEYNGFLMAIKIRRTTFFGGALKSSFPCHRILRRVKSPMSMKTETSYAKFTTISHQFYPASLPDVSVDYFQSSGG
jgi:hypothetical protein